MIPIILLCNYNTTNKYSFFQKYNIITFLPIVLYEQFRFFLNMYFLVMAVSQFIPSIRIGYLYTYWGPLCFVLAVTLFREAVDDFRRYRWVILIFEFLFFSLLSESFVIVLRSQIICYSSDTQAILRYW